MIEQTYKYLQQKTIETGDHGIFSLEYQQKERNWTCKICKNNKNTPIHRLHVNDIKIGNSYCKYSEQNRKLQVVWSFHE